MRRRNATGSTARTSSPSTVMWPLVGVDQPVRQPQQRGLAGAGAADDGEKLALGDLERDVVDGQNGFRAAAAVKALADMRKGDQGGVGIRLVSCFNSYPPLQGRVSILYHFVELVPSRR